MNFIVGFLIVFIFVFVSIIIAFFNKKPTIVNMIVKNNTLELYDDYGYVITYDLNTISIKYNIYNIRPNRSKVINVQVNEDYFSSINFNVYDLEPYIAFFIFISLLKRNEIQNIPNLNDNDIKILQQNIIFSEE